MPITASEAAAEVIRRSDISPTSVKLPSGQLERGLYLEVSKILEAAGGKWNRKAQAHVFGSDPREKLADFLDSGKITSAKQDFGAFYTPEWLACLMVDVLNIGDRDRVLEPSAGEGAIAGEVISKCGRVRCCEIREECLPFLSMDGATTRIGDFLHTDSWQLDGPFDAVVMNPPFAKSQDVEHVLHAASMLLSPMRLAAIMSSGVTFRNDRKTKAFRAWMREHKATCFRLPEDTFKKSGTGVNAVLVVVSEACPVRVVQDLEPVEMGAA